MVLLVCVSHVACSRYWIAINSFSLLTDLKHVTSETQLNTDVNVTSFHESTDVKFAAVTPEIIRAYIDTGEPM